MKTKKKKGFTLTELIVVIVIIGVLAAVMIPTLTGYITKAQNSKDETLVASLNRNLENTMIMDDLEFYSVYDVQAFLKEVEMENIEVSNKNNLILFDAEDKKFVLVKDVENETIANDFVYHISEYYSYKKIKSESLSNKNSDVKLKPLASIKLGENEENSYDLHRSFIISINGPEIAQVVDAVMDLPTNSNTSNLKSVLSKLDDEIYKLVISSITKTLYVSNDNMFYYDSNLNLNNYDNQKYVNHEIEQNLTRVIVLSDVSEIDLDKISNLQKSTILLPSTLESTKGNVSDNLEIDFIGKVDLLKGTSMEVSECDYTKAFKELDVKEITFIDSFIRSETELYEWIEAYKNSSSTYSKINDLYGEEEAKKFIEENLKKQIILINNITINKSIEIPEYVTLLIPYDEDYLEVGDGDRILYLTKIHKLNSETKEYDFDNYRKGYYKELTIAEGVKVTLNGCIVVAGVTGASGDTTWGVNCQTTGAYGQLTLLDKSELNLGKTGELKVYGYVIGDGSINTTNGSKISEPLVLGDYVGGQNSAILTAEYLGSVVNDNGRTTPFSQYGLNNIQVKMRIVYGSSLNGYVKIYMNDSWQKSELPLISIKSNSFVCMTDIDGYIDISYLTDKIINYNVSTLDNIGQTKMDIYGDIETGEIKITIVTSIITETLSSYDFLLPIPYNFSLNFMSGESIIQTDLAFLPGSELYVNSGAKLTIGSDASLFIIDKLVPNDNGKTSFTYEGYAYPTSKQTKFIVNGTFVIKGTFGGVVQTTEKNAKVITTPNAILDGTNEAKFGSGTQVRKSLYLAVLTYYSKSTMNNYVLEGMLVCDGNLVKLSKGYEYTSKFTESSKKYIGNDNIDSETNIINCYVGGDTDDQTSLGSGKVVFKKVSKDIDRTSLEYSGDWEAKDVTNSFIIVEFESYCNGSEIDVNFGQEYLFAGEIISKKPGIIKVNDSETKAYKFKGLYKEDLITPWDSKIDEPTTIYAVWEPMCLVTFNTNDGSEVSYQVLESGDYVTKPMDPTKEGYQFSGIWYKDSNYKDEFNFETEIITKDTVLYAKFLKECKVTFDCKGGSIDGKEKIEITIIEGHKIIEETYNKDPGVPTKPDGEEGVFNKNTYSYTFKYWYYYSVISEKECDLSSYTVTDDVTLYANYSKTKK